MDQGQVTKAINDRLSDCRLNKRNDDLHELYQWPGLAETVRFDHIKPHYFKSRTKINPFGIVPVGPSLSLNDPPSRDHLVSSVRHVVETELAR